MTNPPPSSNGHAPIADIRVQRSRDANFATRLAAWVVDVAIPKLIPDHVVAPLRRRLRRADDQLERTARRLVGRHFSRAPTARDKDAR